MIRIMRSNYDKPHRCPGWSGPAWKGGDDSCEGGSLNPAYGHDSEVWKHLYKPHWTMYRCKSCSVYVLPNVLRNLDPSWWKFAVIRKVRRIKQAIYRRQRWGR